MGLANQADLLQLNWLYVLRPFPDGLYANVKVALEITRLTVP
jgi:hypothetical protein